MSEVPAPQTEPLKVGDRVLTIIDDGPGGDPEFHAGKEGLVVCIASREECPIVVSFGELYGLFTADELARVPAVPDTEYDPLHRAKSLDWNAGYAQAMRDRTEIEDAAVPDEAATNPTLLDRILADQAEHSTIGRPEPAIQRWDWNWESDGALGLAPNDDGPWVKVADHLRVLDKELASLSERASDAADALVAKTRNDAIEECARAVEAKCASNWHSDTDESPCGYCAENAANIRSLAALESLRAPVTEEN